MKYFLILFAALYLSGCGTLYKPNQNVLTIQNTLDKNSAMKIFSSYLKVGRNYYICGFKGGLYLDGKANPKLTGNKIILNAYEKGDYVKTDEVTQLKYYKKKYYKKTIALKDIDRIDYYTEETYRHGQDKCFEKSHLPENRNKNDIALVFWSGTFERFTIRVHDKNVDRFIAALRVIFPDVKMLLAKA